MLIEVELAHSSNLTGGKRLVLFLFLEPLSPVLAEASVFALLCSTFQCNGSRSVRCSLQCISFLADFNVPLHVCASATGGSVDESCSVTRSPQSRCKHFEPTPSRGEHWTSYHASCNERWNFVLWKDVWNTAPMLRISSFVWSTVLFDHSVIYNHRRKLAWFECLQ